jgi:hypothetical protein
VTAIWLLSTRGRPEACQQVLDACEATGMTSPGIVYVDETPYPKLRLPDNWTVHHEPVWGSLQASMSYVFERYPYASQYGWLADDTLPRTNGWDTLLEKAAGDWCLSYANDLWLSRSDFSRGELEEGDNLSSGLCWGGNLVRAAGWWALPGLRQAGIDTVWTAIVGPLDLARYLHDIVVEHKHYKTGKRERDEGDDWARDGDPYVQRDIDTRDRWVCSEEYRELLTRVGVGSGQPPTARRLRRLERAYRDSAAGEKWFRGAPAARIENAWNNAEVPDALLNPHTDT